MDQLVTTGPTTGSTTGNKMNKNKKQNQGFIAIVSLLIVAAIAMLFAIGMLLDGVDNAALSLSSINYEQSRVNVVSCLEDTLYRIRQEEKFDQTLNYQLTTDQSCSVVIEWFAPQQVTLGIVERLANLDITGQSQGFSRTFRYELKISRHDVHHANGTFEYMNTIDVMSLSELFS